MNSPRHPNFIALILIFSVFLVSATHAAVTVTGTVRNAAGLIPLVAHVHRVGFDGQSLEAIETIPVSDSGAFSILLPGPGLHRLLISAVNHTPVSIPLNIPSDLSAVKVHAVLAPLNYTSDFTDVYIIGSWTDYNRRQPERMTRQRDGSYVYWYSGTSKTIGYQILGILDTPMHSVNGTMSDRYEYDGGGDYLSILDTHKEPGEIRFEPEKLPRWDAHGLPAVTFQPENLSDMFSAEQITQKGIEAFLLAGKHFRKDAAVSEEMFRFNWNDTISSLTAISSDAKDPLSRQFAAAQLINLSMFPNVVNPETIKRMIGRIPPDSFIWSIVLLSNVNFYDVMDADSVNTLLTNLSDKNPHRVTRALALGQITMKYIRMGKMAQAQKNYTVLKANYNDVEAIQPLLTLLNPDKAIQAGKPVPDFSITLMDGTTKVSRSSLMGTFYLIDFWATWCTPCVGEMEHLHKVYNAFKDKNFTILSVSLDRKSADVDMFRKDKWKMPWMHAFLGIRSTDPVLKIFEIQGIPKPVLVGPKGNIVAVDVDLRGGNLEATIKKHLPPR
jgi:thiol-disulfide isomerase/thioredoxin